MKERKDDFDESQVKKYLCPFAALTLSASMIMSVMTSKSSNEQLLDIINARINKNLDDTFEVLNKNKNLIDEIQDTLLMKSISDFNLKLAMLNT